MFSMRTHSRQSYVPVLLLSIFMCSSQTALADSSKTFGDYEVFYSVLNSTFITPEVAKIYGIVRGKDRGLVNIAVRKNLPKGQSQAHPVRITGTSSDLIHSIPLTFTEIRETGAIYYIAEFSFHDKDLRTFTLEIQTEPNITPYTLKFTKKLYEE